MKESRGPVRYLGVVMDGKRVLIREFDVHIGQNCQRNFGDPLFALKASSPNEQRPLYLNVNWWINKPAFDSSEYTEIYTCS